MKIQQCHDQNEAFAKKAICLVAAIFCSGIVVRGMAAPQAEKGAVGIVHSAPVVPKSPEPAVQEFVELPPAEMPVPAMSLHCSLDLIDGHPAPLAMVLDHRVAVTFVGWIAGDKSGVPQNVAVILAGDKTYRIVGTTGLARPDVAAAKHNSAFISAGFSVAGRPTALPQGEYRLAVVAQVGTARELCPLGRIIAIK